MDKLRMHTPDKADENFRKLAALFPNAVTETISENGEVVRAIDKDVLMQEINTTVVDGREERYQFTWPDKKQAVLLANSPISKTLRPCRAESADFDTTENLYIEGDNLDVLKLLQETYLGRVRMIYIDPPYNTGNDFVYNDDFTESTAEYLANSGQFDDAGNRLVQNTENNGRFHTDWLNMMFPRLRLAKDLLAEDGVIFISIGEQELNNLINCCDEIFASGNRITIFNRVTKKSSNNGDHFSPCVDYIVAYAKNIENVPEYQVGMTEDIVARYNKTDEYVQERGPYQEVGLFMSALKHGGSNYPIECPDGSFAYPPNGQPWRWNEKTFLQGKSEGRIVFKKTAHSPLLDTRTGEHSSWNIYTKVYLNERAEKGMHPKNFSDEFQNTLSSNELRKMQIPFDFAKPTSLVKFLAQIQTKDDDIVLDFFSGSATTAHAVMQLNAEDGGNRKFIMVQLPEETAEKSDAYKAGYMNICEIGKERIRRAAKKIKEEHPEAKFDGGFRVLKLDSSNMKDVYYSPTYYTPDLFDTLADNIKEDRTPEDLLFQVMLDLGILLSAKIEESVIDGRRVFSVEEDYLIACFDENVTEETITAIAKQKPYYFIMRDSSMASDSVAANFEQIFAAYSPDTVRKVL